MSMQGKRDTLFFVFLIPLILYGQKCIKGRQSMKGKSSCQKCQVPLISHLRCIFLSHSLRDVFIEDIDKGGECWV